MKLSAASSNFQHCAACVDRVDTALNMTLLFQRAHRTANGVARLLSYFTNVFLRQVVSKLQAQQHGPLRPDNAELLFHTSQ